MARSLFSLRFIAVTLFLMLSMLLPSVVMAGGADAGAGIVLFEPSDIEALEAIKAGGAETGDLKQLHLDEPVHSNGLFYGLLAASLGGVVCVILWYKLGYLERMPVGIRVYAGLCIMLGITVAVGVAGLGFQAKLAHHAELVRLGVLSEFALEKAARHENDLVANAHKHPERIGAYERSFLNEMTHASGYLSQIRDLEQNQQLVEAVGVIGNAKTEFQQNFRDLAGALHEIDQLRMTNRSLSQKLLADLESLITLEREGHDALVGAGASAEKVLENSELIGVLERVEAYWVRTINEQSNFMLDIDLAHIPEVEHDLNSMLGAIVEAEAMLGVIDPGAHDVERIAGVLSLARADAKVVAEGFRTIVRDEYAIESLLGRSHALLESAEHTLEQFNEHNLAIEHLAVSDARRVSVLLIVMGAVTVGMVGFVMSTSIVSPIRTLVAGLGRLVEGDLREQIQDRRSDEFGRLFRAYNAACTQLGEIITEVQSNSYEIADTSSLIDERATELARGMESQRNQTGQVSAAVEELSASIGEVAQNSQSAADLSRTAGEKAVQGGSIVDQTIEGMNAIGSQVLESVSLVSELHKQSEQIGQVISVINEIADQTNLLALNAAIEAARAGEHGRGFAVVADEVRKLAERTTSATEEVRDSIQAMQLNTETAAQNMQHGRELANEGQEFSARAGDSLREIVGSSNEVAPVIAEIAAAAQEQSGAANDIASSIETIDTVSREAADGIREVSQSSNDLSSKSQVLRELVGRFRV